VSTGRMDVRVHEEPQSGSLGTFETRDFYLACFLRCTGYELLDLRAEGRRRVFVFHDRATRRQDVISFYGESGSVHALAFAAAIKDMKALLHNA
jgi:Domain of unknown function (DUF5659)